jgi:hypothetical protein
MWPPTSIFYKNQAQADDYPRKTFGLFPRGFIQR